MPDPGELELDILTKGTASTAPAPAAEPRSSTLHVLTTLEELRAAVVAVAAGAQRLMSIYTPDLEPELYDQTPFLDIVKRFVLARRFAKVRVLLEDSTRTLRDGNRFVAMGRRLSSYIDVRIVQNESSQRASAYLIADDRAVVYRMRTDRWDGIVDYDCPPVARLHLAQFDEAWIANDPGYSLLRRARR